MKRIAVVSSGLFHPPLMGRMRLRRYLKAQAQFQFRFYHQIEQVLEDEQWFDAVVVYFHRREIDNRYILQLGDYVRGGGGLLALHSATASFKQNDIWWDLLGGRFTRHGRIEALTIKQNQLSGIFGTVPEFTIYDELYVHAFQDGCQPQFFAQGKSGAGEAVWTREYGAGRVCYIMFGHVSGVFLKDEVRAILTDGLRWVSREAVN